MVSNYYTNDHRIALFLFCQQSFSIISYFTLELRLQAVFPGWCGPRSPTLWCGLSAVCCSWSICRRFSTAQSFSPEPITRQPGIMASRGLVKFMGIRNWNLANVSSSGKFCVRTQQKCSDCGQLLGTTVVLASYKYNDFLSDNQGINGEVNFYFVTYSNLVQLRFTSLFLHQLTSTIHIPIICYL